MKDNKNNQENKEEDNLIEEIGGPKGLNPTRFGDWERNGKAVDF